ncbi:transposase [Candidatus Protochlamydia phocaeensis]|uniref:transposase n=1 Tax=Candidatus Protochlamydia phocaeensis TaxID=1414722 RepID=UPI000838F87E|nr:transposase [Candidatus Protochlamydia phocaeensis]
MPTYSLICKRACLLKDSLPKLSLRCPQTVLLDASGLKVIGEGEWNVKIHGSGRPRKWIKIHLAVDPKTQEIVAHAITVSQCSDGAEELLKQSGKTVKTVGTDLLPKSKL